MTTLQAAATTLREHDNSDPEFVDILAAVDGPACGLGAVVVNSVGSLGVVVRAAEWVAGVSWKRGAPVDDTFGADELPRTGAGADLEHYAVHRPGRRRVALPPPTVSALQAYLAERLRLLAVIAPMLQGADLKAATREIERATRIRIMLKQRVGRDGSIQPLAREAA